MNKLLSENNFGNIRRSLIILSSIIFMLNVTKVKLESVNLLNNTIDISSALPPFNNFNNILLIICLYFYTRYLNHLERENIFNENRNIFKTINASVSKSTRKNDFLIHTIIFRIIYSIGKLFSEKFLFHILPIIYYWIILLSFNKGYLQVVIIIISCFLLFTLNKMITTLTCRLYLQKNIKCKIRYIEQNKKIIKAREIYSLKKEKLKQSRKRIK